MSILKLCWPVHTVNLILVDACFLTQAPRTTPRWPRLSSLSHEVTTLESRGSTARAVTLHGAGPNSRL